MAEKVYIENKRKNRAFSEKDIGYIGQIYI
jgi:hypothetical protein